MLGTAEENREILGISWFYGIRSNQARPDASQKPYRVMYLAP
jgi:hypothetical protein